jgi:hypothetical protein
MCTGHFGHSNSDHRMNRNFPRNSAGDAIYAVLVGCHPQVVLSLLEIMMFLLRYRLNRYA